MKMFELWGWKIPIQRSGTVSDFVSVLDHIQRAYEIANLLVHDDLKPEEISHIRSLLDQIGNFTRSDLADPQFHDQSISSSMRKIFILGLPGQSMIKQPELFLNKIVVQSPGFVELVGKLNPLEFIRSVLSDHHERQKDLEYRNEHEKMALVQDIKLKEIKILEEKLKVFDSAATLLRDVGVEDAEIKDFLLPKLNKHLMNVHEQADAGLVDLEKATLQPVSLTDTEVSYVETSNKGANDR